MSLKLGPYLDYRDSGVPWLGRIPAHWEVRRAKYLLREVDARSCDGSEPLLSVSQYTGVTLRRAVTEQDTVVTRAESLVGYKKVTTHDLAVNIMLAWNGSLGVAPCSGIVSPAYCVYRFRPGARPSYYHHLLRSPLYRGRIRAVSTGVVQSRLRLYTDDLFRVEALAPPTDEQRAIASFADLLMARTDRILRAKRRLIALLNEQKQAIIHRAVTRGLDPNVRLKPSGVDWLGDVPDRWAVTSLRRLISFITSGSRGWAEFYDDEGDLFIQSGNLGRSMALDLQRVQRVRVPRGAEGRRTKVARGDVLVCITGALTGNVAFVSEELPQAYVNQHVGLLRPNPRAIMPRFLAYALHSTCAQTQFKLTEYGGTKQGLGLDDVRDTLVSVPGREEQRAIVARLDLQCGHVMDSIDQVRREVALLLEYRTSLISDVVTGKLDVRDVELPTLDVTVAGDLSRGESDLDGDPDVASTDPSPGDGDPDPDPND